MSNPTAFLYGLHVSPIKIPPQDQTQHIKAETSVCHYQPSQ